MPARRYTPELVDEIIRAYYLEGESQVSIARRLGTSRNRIYHVMRAAGRSGRSPAEAARLREEKGRGVGRRRND